MLASLGVATDTGLLRCHRIGVVDDVDPGFGDPSFVDSSSGSFSGAFGPIIVLVVIGVVVSIAMGVRRAHKYHEAGLDPLDPETDLKVRMAQRMGMASPPAGTTATERPPVPDGRTTAERLTEVDRLHEAGAISAIEHQAARARVLGTL